MTLIAGILGRRPGHPIDPLHCEELKKAISRNRNDTVTIFEDKAVFLAKVDVGAYGWHGFRVSPAGSVAMLAGEFLLSLDTPRIDGRRDKDLALFHESWDRDDWTILPKADGVFCAAHYDPISTTLTLVSDKLGIRPLYYWMDSEYVVFGSALRILESLSFFPKKMDLRGVTEIVGLGHALETRTPYSGLKVMAAAEVLRFSSSPIRSHRYWSWDRFSSVGITEQERLENLTDSFKAAVVKRLRQDTCTVSFLSGGLDSRCIVAALREQNTEVYTFNFGFSGAQDQIFASAFARASGTVHFEGRMPVGDPRWSMMISDAWRGVRGGVSSLPEHSQLFWSGDGGSVGLGHVYLNRRIVDLMRKGNISGAIDTYLSEQKMRPPYRLFLKQVAARLRDVLHIGIREELAAIQCEDPGRAFHIFLMLNDQRRHLMNHFEDIDLHRIELQLPFFDSQFLSTIMTFPIETCLNHGAYTQWLKKFQSVVTSVPWQTYPGHDPCPLPAPTEAAYQWSDSKLFRDHRRARKQKLITDVWRILVSKEFPSAILRRKVLWGATFLSLVGIRDCSHLLNAALMYSSFPPVVASPVQSHSTKSGLQA